MISMLEDSRSCTLVDSVGEKVFILENGDPTEALSTWQDNCFVSNHTTMLYGIFIHFSKGFSLTLNKNGSSNTITFLRKRFYFYNLKRKKILTRKIAF